MKIDRKRAYLFEILLVCILVVCAFFTSAKTKYILAIISIIGVLFVNKFFKKKASMYTNIKKVNNVMILFGILYIG